MTFQADEKRVKLAAKLYEARDTIRTLLGDRYRPEMKRIGEYLMAMATQSGTTELKAALEVAKRCAGPHAGMKVLAAAVELVEPSEEANHG